MLAPQAVLRVGRSRAGPSSEYLEKSRMERRAPLTVSQGQPPPSGGSWVLPSPWPSPGAGTGCHRTIALGGARAASCPRWDVLLWLLPAAGSPTEGAPRREGECGERRGWVLCGASMAGREGPRSPVLWLRVLALPPLPLYRGSLQVAEGAGGGEGTCTGWTRTATPSRCGFSRVIFMFAGLLLSVQAQ